MPKPILKDVLTLASKSLWQDVISATDNVSDLVKQPRLFGFRLEASIALADEENPLHLCGRGSNEHAATDPICDTSSFDEGWSGLRCLADPDG